MSLEQAIIIMEMMCDEADGKKRDAIEVAIKYLKKGRDECLVKCSDCRFAEEYKSCSFVTFWNRPTDYCSKGERK